MSEKNPEKDINSKESKKDTFWKRTRKTINTLLLTLWVAGSINLAINKWDNFDPETRIEAVSKEQKVLIEAYNIYFDEYEAMGKTLVELQAEGDLAGYRNTLDQREALQKEIKNVEERIDKLGRRRQKLEIDLTEGKVQAERDITPIPHAKGLERRTFKEYQ